MILAAAVLTLACTVTQVLDGDTLVAQCPTAGRVHIRLAEIDAPEKRQPYGRAAAAHLRRLCLGQPATITTRSRDHYGRTVGRVECSGQDASAAQVAKGYAWPYPRYQTDAAIPAAAELARAQRLGLWRAARPIRPEDWRKKR